MMCKLYRYILFVIVLFLWKSGLFAQTAADLKLSHVDKNGYVEYKDFIVCNDGEPPFKFQLKNETTQAGFTSFKLKLGDAEHTEVVMSKPGSSKTLTYSKAGSYTLQFVGITDSGKELTKEYSLRIIGKPNVRLQKQDELVKCLGSEVQYIIDVLGGGTDGTKYTLNYDDHTAVDHLMNNEIKDGKGIFIHKYNRSYCQMEDHPYPYFEVTLTYENECYSGKLATVSEAVAEPFDALYTFDRLGKGKVCTYEKLTLRNLTKGGTSSDCGPGNRLAFWDFGNGETSEDWAPYIEYKNAGNYHITLKVSNDYACATDSVSKPIELISRTKAMMEVKKSSICAGETLKFYNRSTGDEIRSHWTVIPLDGAPLPDYEEYAISPEIQFNHWGRYKVKLFINNVCSEDEADTTILVRQNPDLLRYDIPVEICLSDPVDFSRYLSIEWNGNEEKAEWTITRKGAIPNTGFTCVQGSLHSAFPAVQFEIPGIYEITVNLPDIGCGGTKITETKQVIVHDPAIHIQVDTTLMNICEKGIVHFTNHSLGEELQYEWSVSPASGVTFVNGTKRESASPAIQFNKYGDYQVFLHTYTKSGCGQADTSFRVHVRKDPSIFFFEPPEAVCPGSEYALNFEGLVEYRFYNNPEKVKWTINPSTGGYEFKEGTGVNTLKPVIQFNTPGPYMFTVELESAGCPDKANDQLLTRTIRVRNSSMSMQASVDNTLVCENEELLFGMKVVTAENDPLIYSWTVSPSDGNFEFQDYGNDKKIARILFKRWGTYEVRGSASGFCGMLDSVFRITVQKDPVVAMRDTAGLCPGVVDMRDYVTYKWYNNTPQLTWKITRVGVNPTKGFKINDIHAEYPKIDFQEPGEYKVQVELVSNTVGCAGDSLQVMKTFRIYDVNITGDIKMLGEGVIDPTDICEGETITFDNTTNAEGKIEWNWTVEGQTEGYVFGKGGKTSTERNPKITFLKYGDYKVHVQIVSACNGKEYTFPVKVRGIPQVVLTDRLKKICEGETIDMQDPVSHYLSYPDAEKGNKNQADIMTYSWSVTSVPGVSHLPVITSPDQEYTAITFSEHAHYVIKLEVGMKCVEGGKLEKTSEVDVIANSLKAAFTVGKDSIGCTNGSEVYEVKLQNQSEGDSLVYQWKVWTENGDWEWTEGNEKSESPEIKIKREGIYQVTLRAESCNVDDTTFVLKAFSVPEVNIRDISEVCEPFEFRGKADKRIDIQLHNDGVRSAQWKLTTYPGATVPEYKFINNTSDTSFYPDIQFKAGDYKVMAEYWNRCQTPGRDTFLVKVDRFIPITSIKDGYICAQSPVPYLLNARPNTGVWTLKDASLPEAGKILYRENDKYYFNPVFDAYKEREVELVYKLRNFSCVDSSIVKMHIWPLPFVEAGERYEMCLNQDPVLLTGRDSAGGEVWQTNRGHWEWENDTLSDHYFRAKKPGDFTLKYYFTDQHKCQNTDSARMIVHPLPDTAFMTRPQFCLGDTANFIVNSKEKRYLWEYYEGAVTDTLKGSGWHVYHQPGYYDVTLVTESDYGCRDTSASKKIEIVNDAPPAIFSMSTHAACGPEVEINIGVTEADYQDHNLKFEWDFGNGNIIDRLLCENPQKYKAGIEDTMYYLKFRVYNICNETSKVDTLLVGSLPEVKFHFENGERNCSPLHLQVLNASTGSDNHYTWYMGDGKEPQEVYEPKGYLYETGSQTKVFEVSLVAENKCGRDSIMQPLTVLAQTLDAFFDKPKNDICVGEEICFTNYTRDTSRYVTYKYWDFGDQVRDTSWNACHVYRESGTYNVMLYVDNGCASDTMSKQIQVIALPHVIIEADSVLCDREVFHFAFNSDQSLQWHQWSMGDDSIVLDPAFPYVYSKPGEYSVKLEVVADNRAFCKAQVEKKIAVNPRPVLKVIPFDTLVCPPYLYLPQVTGEAKTLIWDYGEGQEHTTSLEHLYENDTDSVLHRRVVLHAVSDKGCPEDFTGRISVANLPHAAMSKEITDGHPQKVDLINLSKDYTECIWYLPEGKVLHTFDNQHLEFMENGRHEFSLVTFNEYGCKDSTVVDHEVLIKGLYFPNTFIPHSQNGKVNRFNGIGMGLLRYKLEIFDQYYNKIWETQALENGKPSEGWDGCNGKGERMPQGVYIWRAEAIFGDDEVWTGKNNPSGVSEKVQGTVLLLRE